MANTYNLQVHGAAAAGEDDDEIVVGNHDQCRGGALDLMCVGRISTDLRVRFIKNVSYSIPHNKL